MKKVLIFVVLTLFLIANGAMAADKMVSQPFKGAKANKGTVTFTKKGNKMTLTLSDDFVVPDTPDPHWQVVDSKGNTYLLQKYIIKDDKYNQTITLPGYVTDVAKVQSWCSFAETLLGEAIFDKPMM
jgi:hypothetical protein